MTDEWVTGLKDRVEERVYVKRIRKEIDHG